MQWTKGCCLTGCAEPTSARNSSLCFLLRVNSAFHTPVVAKP